MPSNSDHSDVYEEAEVRRVFRASPLLGNCCHPTLVPILT